MIKNITQKISLMLILFQIKLVTESTKHIIIKDKKKEPVLIMINKKNQLFWLFLLLLVGVCRGDNSKKVVCIIGAGVSGLTSANQLAKDSRNFEPIVFERGTDIGGVWKYTDRTDLDENGLPVHSAMYKDLRANGPIWAMTIPDYKEFHGKNTSFVRHERILDYLRNYTEHFNLRQYIKLNTLVEKVVRQDLFNDKWRVHTRDLKSHTTKDYNCDAVMVGVGNYFKPNLPVIPGLNTFRGRTMHSHSYRKPEEFANKTVVILGASFSGLDIGIDVSSYAKTVYLSHRHKKLPTELTDNIVQIPGVVAAKGNDLILSNGSHVRADAFIICTGYQYYFPFLDPIVPLLPSDSGITVTEGKYIHPLYKQFVNINHPTMVFLGVPSPGILVFILAYFQAHYFSALLRGTAKLPSRAVMLKDSQLPPGKPISKAHVMDVEVPDYIAYIAKAAGMHFNAEPFKKVMYCNKVIIASDYLHFRDYQHIIRDNGRVDIVYPNNTMIECLLPK